MNSSESKSLTWQEHWQNNQTPWDAGDSAPALLELLKGSTLQQLVSSKLDSGRAKALVAGCGRGYDVFHLAHAGFSAVGIDLAPALVPHFELARSEAGVPAEHAELQIGSFFEFATTHAASFDFAWDYTFLCALDPELREQWQQTYQLLIRPGGLLATLIFPLGDPENSSGSAPHPLNFELVENLLRSEFELVSRSLPSSSHPGREGKEELALWKRRAQ